MFYYQIAPLEKIRTEKFPVFTYASEKKIPPLSLVKIPLRKKTVLGLVWLEVTRPFFPTKKITRILEESFLKENQVQLAEKISDHYLASLNETLKLFFPPQVREKNRPKKTTLTHQEISRPAAKKIIPTSSQKKAIKKINEKSKGSFLVFGPASSGKTLVVWEAAKKKIRQKKQVLVILPEIFLAHQEAQRWQEYLALKDEEVFFVHSSTKKTVYREKWEKIKNGEIKLIIGSRSGLLLPFFDLGLIVVDEEQDNSHKQWDRPPFYNAKKVAALLAEISSAQIIFLSATPTPESFFDKKNQLIQLPRLKKPTWEIKKPQIILADLKKNFFSRKKSPLTEELVRHLTETLNQKKIAFLFVPRRGFARKIICSDCHKPLICTKCNTNLSDLGEKYQCLKCGFQKSPFLACSHCGSFRLKSLGIGTEKIAREIKNLFPQKTIRIADRKSFQKEKDRKELWQSLKDRKIDVLVGTQAITKGFDLPFLGLTAVLEGEGLVGKNDFRFDEKKLGLLFQLAGRLNRPQSDQKGIFVLQTYQPEEPFWLHLKELDWQKWLKEENLSRENTVYPPFCQLTKITYGDKKSSSVEKNIKKMYTALVAEKNLGNLLSLAIFPDQPKRFLGAWKQSILLKTSQPIKNTPPLRAILKKTLAANGWTVDVDPENIF